MLGLKILLDWAIMIIPFAIVALVILFFPFFKYKATGQTTCILAYALKKLSK